MPLVVAAARGGHGAGRFYSSVALLLLAALVMRLVRLEADPPREVSRDLSLLSDGSWYTSAALDRIAGRETSVPASYDRPLYTAYVECVYRVFGTGLWTTNFASVPPAVLAVLFTALLGRRLGGPSAGLLAAALLAFNYSFVVFSRNAVIYPFLTMVSAAVLWLGVRGTQKRCLVSTGAAWALAIAGALLLKEVLVLVVPGLLLGWPLAEALRRRPLATCGALAATGAAIGAVVLGSDVGEGLAQKLADYFGAPGARELLGRLAELEDRSGFFRALPFAAPLALASPLLARGLSRPERMAWLPLALGPLIFAPCAYSPLRYVLVLFPVAAALGATAAMRLISGRGVAERGISGRDAPDRTPGAFERWIAPGLLVLLAHPFAASWTPGGGAPRLAVWTILAVLVLWAAARPRGLPVGSRPLRAAAAGLAALALAVHVLHGATLVAEARETARHALGEVDAVLAPDAVVSGVFAHLLTMENRMERRLVSTARFGGGALRRKFEGQGVTHLTLEAGEELGETLECFARDGAPLERVHTFHVGGVPVVLFRFASARGAYELSDYERGIDALLGGDLDAARESLGASAERHPGAAAPRSALAELELAGGDPDGASRRAAEALARNPYDVRALVVAGRVLLRAGDSAGALVLLERALALDPADRAIRQAVAALEAAGARAEWTPAADPRPSRRPERGRSGRPRRTHRSLRTVPGSIPSSPSLPRPIEPSCRLSPEPLPARESRSLDEAASRASGSPARESPGAGGPPPTAPGPRISPLSGFRPASEASEEPLDTSRPAGDDPARRLSGGRARG